MSPANNTSSTRFSCATEWPALSPLKISSDVHGVTDSDWELLSEDHEDSAQNSFGTNTVHIVEPRRLEIEGADSQDENYTNKRGPSKDNLLCLKHAQSTPDFRYYNTILEENSDDEEAVLIDVSEEGVGSVASPSIVMVSGPPSIISSQSCWSTSLKSSFRDVIMKEMNQEDKDQTLTEMGIDQQARQSKKVRKKPKFVVKPIRRCSKSTGDLQATARIAENGDHNGGDDSYNDDFIVGDTDAELYYNQKAHGKLGRKNGRKIRPDEAKRLQITMAKKDDQRQRQNKASKKS
jgi:hypothetical protein